MNCRKIFAASFGAALGLAAVVGSFAVAQQDRETPAQQQQMPLPPGWTEADMQACMVAGTPGEMHKLLAADAGTWEARTSMMMYPGAEPMTTVGTTTISPIMDGRYVFMEMTGEMPGMGPYHGSGVCGFDNVSQKFVSAFIDNHSTGIMNGTGELSRDKKTLTWTYTYNCPINKKPTTIREVHTTTGTDTKTIEAWTKEPKTGEEFKMMTIELTRKGAAPAAPAAR